jgi:ubiquinone/menaquinone biosynthesis C-methylase UbiE
MKIIDIGCGSVRWNNINNLPVTGVDINENMLDYAIKKNRLQTKIVWNLEKGGIDLEDEMFDIVILSEVLEHMEDPAKLLREANRLSKRNGHIIITVPLDTAISLWRILFEIGCFIRGDLLGQEYFKERCGHIQHFSVEDITQILEKSGYSIVEKNITILNIGIIAQKKSSAPAD